MTEPTVTPGPRGYLLPENINKHLVGDHQIPERLVNNPSAEPGLYLELSHGRVEPDQEMDGWGTDCPDEIGPLSWVHFTYNDCGKIGIGIDQVIWLDNNFTREACLLMPPNSLCRHDDMLYWNGVFYGDWSFNFR